MSKWIEPAAVSIPSEIKALSLSPFIQRLLVRRELTSHKMIEAFLDPGTFQPSHASELPDMAAALERIARAKDRKESVCVWGDFDVDGLTATSILVEVLIQLGLQVTYHIPIRAKESHGLNIPALKGYIDNGISLIVTCDTGITAHEAAEYAVSHNVDLIITDHHSPTDTIPPAVAVINPKRLSGSHPLHSLSGSGVAYKLVEALSESIPGIQPSKDSLDLAALGLVADLVPLKNDTRYLVQLGLRELRTTKRVGIRKIVELADLNLTDISEQHISFSIGPRLNSLGRLGDANPAVELLTTSSQTRAQVLATQLEGYNAQRQLLTKQIFDAVESKLTSQTDLISDPIIILDHPSWPAGVLGIAASRIVEKYKRPAILLATQPDGTARGSARSINGIHITEIIATQKQLLHSFGGHPMAAGLSLDAEKIPAFRRGIIEALEPYSSELTEAEELRVDEWLLLSEVNYAIAESLNALSPFGPGNERPVMATRNVLIKESTFFGRNKEHRRLLIADQNGARKEVLWWQGAEAELPAGILDMAFTLRSTDYRGEKQAVLELADFRSSQSSAIEIPTKHRKVIDFRNIKDPHSRLEQLPASTKTWVEGIRESGIKGQDRTQLSPTEVLAIWTIPPGPTELRQALEISSPETLVLFAASPHQQDAKSFLTHLAGLTKYTLNQYKGRVEIAKLASELAARTAAVKSGLECLKASGQLDFREEDDGQIAISLLRKNKDEATLSQWLNVLEYILVETEAYRAYYLSAPVDSLI